jgi:hypothetical protein
LFDAHIQHRLARVAKDGRAITQLDLNPELSTVESYITDVKAWLDQVEHDCLNCSIHYSYALVLAQYRQHRVTQREGSVLDVRLTWMFLPLTYR